MDNKELLIRFIEEVIAEHDGIYNWSWLPHWDERDHQMELENNPDLWRAKIMQKDWMVNNPAWNVYEIGMYYVNDDGEVTHREDLTILVDKKKTVNEFVREYKDKWDTPRYIEWVDILGADGGRYEDIDEATGPFEFLIEEKRLMDKPSQCQPGCHTDGDNGEETMTYYKEIAGSTVIY